MIMTTIIKDIQRAIEVEREYIQYRLKNEEPYSLINRVKECGFNNLDEYFNDKLDYLVKSLDFNICDGASDEGAQMTIDAATDGIPLVVFCKATSTNVYHGDEDLNDEYCRDNNIPILEYHSSGGNIVISEGDMAIGLSIPVHDVSSEYILTKLANIISKYENDVYVDKNDILVDGYKVAGSANYSLNNGIGFVIHFSFSDKNSLIQNICVEQPSIKSPGYLKNISTDQLRQEVIAWLQKP